MGTMTEATRAGSRALHERRLPCEIMHEILRLAREGHGKTRIMYGANISYSLLVRYLAFFETRGYLVKGAGRAYKVTPEGEVLMQDLARLLRHFQDDNESPAGERASANGNGHQAIA